MEVRPSTDKSIAVFLSLWNFTSNWGTSSLEHYTDGNSQDKTTNKHMITWTNSNGKVNYISSAEMY